MENRVGRLEGAYIDQRVAIARLQEQVTNLTKSVDVLVAELAPLREAVSRGKGALALMVIIAGIGGALMNAFISRLLP